MLKQAHDVLIYWDHVIWYYLNTQWHTPVLDAIIPFLRNQWFWVPLYVFLALFIPSKFKKRGFIWCAAFIIAFVISDQVSAHLMKPYFHRVRPCNNPYLAGVIHLLVPCGSGLSFPSSHASNHFALGVFSAMTLGRRARWVWTAGIAWAVVVSFSQVYVGVHYPLDVTVGAIVGTTIGIIVGKIYNRYWDLKTRPAELTASEASV